MRKIEIPCTEDQKEKIINSILNNLNKGSGLSAHDICEIFDEETMPGNYSELEIAEEISVILTENIQCVKPPRWRADKGDEYYYVSHVGRVICGSEQREPEDTAFYNSGNYFKSDEKAELYAEKWRALFSENGKL